MDRLSFRSAAASICAALSSNITLETSDQGTNSPGFTGRMRYRHGAVLAGLAAVGLLLCGAGTAAQAQTANFSGAVSTLASSLGAPQGTAVDGNGDVFFSNSVANSVEELVAVNGVVPANFTPITVATGFNGPVGLAVDASGDVFVADSNNGAVKELAAVSGVVQANTTPTTVASGFTLPTGVAVDRTGNVFVADFGSQVVDEIVAGTTTGTPVGGSFNAPFGVAVDAIGDVFVADFGNLTVDEIATAGNGGLAASSTVIARGFSEPVSLAVDASGDVFVADAANSVIDEIVAIRGEVPGNPTMIALGSGFSAPFGVAVDASGDVFVADSSNGAMKEIATQSVNFGSVAVNTTSPITIPVNFAFSAGGSIAAPVVLTQGAAGKDFTDAGTGSCTTNGSTAYAAGSTCTVNVTFTPQFPGQRIGSVQLMSGSTVVATANLFGTGTGPMITFPGNTGITPLGGGFVRPTGVAVDASGDVFVGDNFPYEIPASTGAATPIGSGISSAAGVAVDGSGDVISSDDGDNAVKEIVAVNGAVSSASTVITLGNGFNRPSGLAVDASGDVFVADSGNNAVKEIIAVNGAVSSASTVITLGTGFDGPGGVAVDASGDVFVADTRNNAVKEIVAVNGVVSPSSTVITVGSGFAEPFGLAVDSTGDVFVADTFNSAVKEIVAVNGVVSSNSTVVTVGSGFNGPSGVALDASGDVFVADSGNTAVKEINESTPSGVAFGYQAAGSTSAVSSLIVQNAGNSPLNFSSVAPVGLGFALDGSTTCSTTTSVAADMPCTIGVTFEPPTIGSFSGSVALSSNNLNIAASQTTVPLTGTGSIASLVITGIPVSVAAGTQVQATVTALDANGNTVTSFTGQTATISFSTLGGMYPATITFTSGVAPLNFTPLALNSSSTITVSDEGVAASATFAVTAAAASQIVVNPTTVSAGTGTLFSISAAEEDAYGNVVPSTLTVAITPGTGGAGASGPASAISGTTSAFTANNSSGQYTITFSAAGLTPASVTVTNTASMQYVVTVLTDNTDTGTGTMCVEQTSGTGDNSQCSLREAIEAANQQNGSVITFAAGLATVASPGTISLNLGFNGGDMEVDTPATIVGPGSGALIVDATGGSSAFDLEANTVISGMTVQNAPYGALYSDVNVTSTVNDITFQTNGGPGNYGGGIYNDGTMIVTNSSFLNNAQSYVGGAVYNDGVLTMSNITFQGNNATQVGGAIANEYGGTLQVNNSIFSGNTSPDGGAIYASQNSPVSIQSSTFTANNDMAIDTTTPTVIANSTFSGNTSATVAAVHIGTGSTNSVIRNTTISGNTVTGGGNTAVSVDSGAALTVQNSIVAGNGGSATSTGNCVNCTLAGSNVIDVNPELLALGNYGSPTPQVPALLTMLPMPGSPAICAGALATDLTDERGYPRPTVSGATSCYDIGAVQTAYALAFTQQPTDTTVSGVINPAPAVQLTEQAAGVSGVSVTMSASTGTLSGTATQTTNGSGTASFANLSFNTANAETLTATVGNLSATSSSFNVTSAAGAATATVAVANEQVNAGSAASLSATVTYSGTLPTGAFTFQVDTGSTVTATCNGAASPETCTASYPTTALTGATHTITGSLAADTQYAAASNTGTLTIVAVTPPSFSLTPGSGSTSATVTAGGVASYSFAVAPSSGSYPGAVSFTVTGLPAGATGTFSPSSIAASGGAQTVTLQVQTAVSTASNHQHAPFGPATVPIFFGLLGLPFSFSRKLRSKLGSKLNARLLVLLLLLGGMTGVAGITGCGSSGGGAPTPKSQTYNLTVTATSGSVQQSQAVTLIVQSK